MTEAKERVDPYSWEIDEITRQYHFARYSYAIKFLEGKVLDVGCGTGFGCAMLQKSCEQVIGIDISPDAIKYAKQSFIVGDAQNLPFFDSYFDGIAAMEVIEHVHNPGQTMREIYRVLKPKGVLVISTPNSRGIHSENPYHLKEFTLSEFKTLVQKNGFKIREVHGIMFDPRVVPEWVRRWLKIIIKKKARKVRGSKNGKEGELVKARSKIYVGLPKYAPTLSSFALIVAPKISLS